MEEQVNYVQCEDTPTIYNMYTIVDLVSELVDSTVAPTN